MNEQRDTIETDALQSENPVQKLRREFYSRELTFDEICALDEQTLRQLCAEGDDDRKERAARANNGLRRLVRENSCAIGGCLKVGVQHFLERTLSGEGDVNIYPMGEKTNEGRRLQHYRWNYMRAVHSLDEEFMKRVGRTVRNVR